MSETCDLLCLDLELAERARKNRLSLEEADQAARRAASLADSTRLLLAAALHNTGEMCVCDLAWVAERTENLVSHHLRRLRADGLATSRREGKMVLYSITPLGKELLGWVLEKRETLQ